MRRRTKAPDECSCSRGSSLSAGGNECRGRISRAVRGPRWQHSVEARVQVSRRETTATLGRGETFAAFFLWTRPLWEGHLVRGGSPAERSDRSSCSCSLRSYRSVSYYTLIGRISQLDWRDGNRLTMQEGEKRFTNRKRGLQDDTQIPRILIGMYSATAVHAKCREEGARAEKPG